MEKNKSFLTYKFKEWARDITSLANPLILIFVPFIFLGATKVFYLLLVALAFNEVFASIIKIVIPKKRPNGQTYTTLLEKIDAGSFPSLHASRTTLVYLTLFSNTDVIAIKVVFLLVIVLVILSRILLKKHFWIDVLGGFVLGLLIWIGFSFL